MRSTGYSLSRSSCATSSDRAEQTKTVDVDVRRVIAEGDLVAVHSNYKTWNMAGVAIYRLNDDGKIIEHWDVLQQVPETTASGNDMFSQLT